MHRLLIFIMSSVIYVGSGNGNSAEAQQFFDRLLTPPTSHREAIYANLLDDLSAGGVLAKLDALYLFAAADPQTATTNLVSGNYKAWGVGVGAYGGTAPTYFTADRGITGSGADNYVLSNFSSTTAAGNFSKNDALIFVVVRSVTQSGQQQPILDDPANAGVVGINLHFDNSTITYKLNSVAATYSGIHSTGFYLLQRTASNAMELFLDNTSIATSSQASSTLSNSNMVLAPSALQLPVAAIGKSLTPTERGVLDTACRAFLTSVGAL